jgi:hypothetical protein
MAWLAVFAVFFSKLSAIKVSFSAEVLRRTTVQPLFDR